MCIYSKSVYQNAWPRPFHTAHAHPIHAKMLIHTLFPQIRIIGNRATPESKSKVCDVWPFPQIAASRLIVCAWVEYDERKQIVTTDGICSLFHDTHTTVQSVFSDWAESGWCCLTETWKNSALYMQKMWSIAHWVLIDIEVLSITDNNARKNFACVFGIEVGFPLLFQRIVLRPKSEDQRDGYRVHAFIFCSSKIKYVSHIQVRMFSKMAKCEICISYGPVLEYLEK